MKPRILLASAASALCLLAGTHNDTRVGVSPNLGDIMMVSFSYCPKGWADLNGQSLPISQNQGLQSLFAGSNSQGIYGSDGRTTVALPDLRGRSALGNGTLGEQPNRVQGQIGGSSSVTMIQAQMPAHSYAFNASTGEPNTNQPGKASIATFPAAVSVYATGTNSQPTVRMHSGAIG